MITLLSVFAFLDVFFFLRVLYIFLSLPRTSLKVGASVAIVDFDGIFWDEEKKAKNGEIALIFNQMDFTENTTSLQSCEVTWINLELALGQKTVMSVLCGLVYFDRQ